MEYQDLVGDYFNRSKANLLAIEERAKSEGDVYDTTQLINSFIGAMIISDVSKRNRQQLLRDSDFSQRIVILKGETRDIPRHVRNALTHGRITLIADDATREISHVQLEDSIENGNARWQAKMAINDISFVLKRLFTIVDKGTAT